MNGQRIIVILSIMSLLCILTGCTGRDRDNQQTISLNTDTSGEPAHEENQTGIKVTFVELGSVKCIPCKMMQPIMEQIENEYGDQVDVVFYDVWTPEGKPYAGIYNIQVIPTQVFLDKDGIEYFRHQGFFPKEDLVKVLKQKGVQ